MNRDELLTKLAMELVEWPHDIPAPNTPGIWSCHSAWCCQAKSDSRKLYEEDWLARRAELINKPSWDDAPEWAQWLAQSENGQWDWQSSKPVMCAAVWDIPGSGGHAWEYMNKGEAPAGHDWRETLERRPQRVDPMLDTQMEPTAEEEEAMRQVEGKVEGMKFDGGKPMVGLLSRDMPRAMMEVARVMTFGANKYAPGNWQYVEDAERRYLDASWRHELQRSMGEPLDDETGLDHLAHKICCDLFRLELALRERES